MPDGKISDDALYSALSGDAYIPVVDPSEPAAEDRNKRILLRDTGMFAVVDNVTTTPYTLLSTATARLIVFKTGSSQVYLPATPQEGLWYEFKNDTSSAKTISGNGNNIKTASAAASFSLGAFATIKAKWDTGNSIWIAIS